MRQLNSFEELEELSASEMADVYDLAMAEIERAIPTRPSPSVPDAYSEIAVRRFEVLCRVDPDEARAFRRVLLSLGIGSDDPRVCLARAQQCSTARGSMELEFLPQNWSSYVSSRHPDRIFYVEPSGQPQWEHPEDDLCGSYRLAAEYAADVQVLDGLAEVVEGLEDVRDAEHARLAQGEQDDDSGVTGGAYLRDELRISRGLPTVKPSSAPSLLGADRSRASGRFSSRCPRPTSKRIQRNSVRPFVCVSAQ